MFIQSWIHIAGYTRSDPHPGLILHFPAAGSSVKPLVQVRTLDIQRRLVLVQAVGLARPVGRDDVDVGRVDVPAHRRAAAREGRDQRLVVRARAAREVAEDDVLDGQRRRELLAQGQVLLPVTLRDLDGVVDVVDDPVF